MNISQEKWHGQQPQNKDSRGIRTPDLLITNPQPLDLSPVICIFLYWSNYIQINMLLEFQLSADLFKLMNLGNQFFELS